MYSEERIYSLLDRMEAAVLLIQGQTSNIKIANDFLNSPEGMFALGGVCMQLVLIGESAKVLNTKNPDYLAKYPEIPWVEIIGLRNMIAHEYHHIDADEIFQVIHKDLPVLLRVLQKMKREI